MHDTKPEVVIFDSVKQEVVLVDQGQFRASVRVIGKYHMMKVIKYLLSLLQA